MTDHTTDAETLQRAREAVEELIRETTFFCGCVEALMRHTNPHLVNEGHGQQWFATSDCRQMRVEPALKKVRDYLDRAAQSAARETAAPVDGGEVNERRLKITLETLHTLGVRLGVLDAAVACDGPQLLTAMSAYSDSLVDPAQAPIPETPVLGERWADDPLVAYLERQWSWSKQTFGPALRTRGIIQHITKELREIEADPHDLTEWVDVMILAMDGFWRHGGKPEGLLPAMQAKQDRNFARAWPDWRTMDEDQAIEHDRSGEAAPAPDQTPPRGGVTVEEIEAVAKPRDLVWKDTDPPCGRLNGFRSDDRVAAVSPDSKNTWLWCVHGTEAMEPTRPDILGLVGREVGSLEEACEQANAAWLRWQGKIATATLSRQSAGAGTETQRIDAWAYGWIDRETPKAFGRETYRDGYANGALDVAVKLRGLIREIDPDIDTRLAAAPPETPPAGSPQGETGGPA